MLRSFKDPKHKGNSPEDIHCIGSDHEISYTMIGNKKTIRSIPVTNVRVFEL